MTFYAYDFLYACYAGLTLTGTDDKRPEWCGNPKQWQKYFDLVNKYERQEI